MLWKRTLAMFLTVLLLTTSNCAAACDMACFLREARFECRQAVQSSSHTKRLHVHCEHMRRQVEPKTASTLSIQKTSGCTHLFCRQPDSLLTSDENIPFARAHVVITIVDASLPSALRFTPQYFVSETPPPVIAPSLSFFSTSLRI